MKVSDKVAVLRALLDRVRANAREPSVEPPSSQRASWAAEAEATAASRRVALRPPADDRWDHAPPPIELEVEPIALAPVELPNASRWSDEETAPRAIERTGSSDAPSDPPDERRDSGGVLLDLDPGELPEVEVRASIPPLSPPPPSRLRAVDSAANADPEAMRFWLSALTSPKSSPPMARATETRVERGGSARPAADVETEPAAPPSARAAAFVDAEGDAVPRAPRVPRWSEPTPTPTPPMSSPRSETSSPALVTPASERVGRITNGPRSRRRSMRFRPRVANGRGPGESGSRWLRGALGIAAGAAIGILAVRLLNPKAIGIDEPARPTLAIDGTRASPPTNSAPPDRAHQAASGAPSTVAPSASSTAAAADSSAAAPSSELARAAAVAAPLPAPELGVPVPNLAEDRGRLLVHSRARATVYVNGVRAGATNAAFDIPCGLRHVRLAKDGLPPPGKSFPMWASEGVAVMVPCRAAYEIELETSD